MAYVEDVKVQPWLRSRSFDLAFTMGVLVLALFLGGVATQSAWLFMLVIYLDVWLLAYPHAASSFTRIAFDRISSQRYWFVLAVLPPLVFVATASAGWWGGVMALNTTYFCWQTWHYTRQSHGIARAYRCVAAPGVGGHDRLSECVIFGFPAWGILHRAQQQPTEFYSSPIWSVALPDVVVIAVGVFALGALLLWIVRQCGPDRSVKSSIGGSLFVMSHVVITSIGYIAIPDITHGWLFINIWHNAQYLLFVWSENARRFQGGIDPSRRFISWLSQPNRRIYYAMTCLGLGAFIYTVLDQSKNLLAWPGLPFVLICHQTLTFHHYLVDAVIWRSKKQPVSRCI